MTQTTIISSGDDDIVLAPDGSGIVAATSFLHSDQGLTINGPDRTIAVAFNDNLGVFEVEILHGKSDLLVQVKGGNVGIGVTSAPSKLSVGGSFNLSTDVPKNPLAPGTPGDIAVDENNIYVCTRLGTGVLWKHLPLNPHTEESIDADPGKSALGVAGLSNSGNTCFRPRKLSLKNGAVNHNVTLPPGTFFVVDGPQDAFTISGFAGGTDGRYIIIYNPTEHDMSVSHDDDDSYLGNKVQTSTGEMVAVGGRGSLAFIYHAADAMWVQVAPMPPG